jgi:hypothetical protein
MALRVVEGFAVVLIAVCLAIAAFDPRRPS